MKRKCNWIKKNSKCHSAFFLGIRQNRTAAATRATHFSSENREPELQLEKEGRVKNQIKERRRESLLWILKFTGVEGHNLQCYISVIRRLVALKKSEKLVLVCICLSWYLLTFGSFWKLISNRKILTSNDKRTYSSCIETFFSSFHVCIGLNLQQSKYRNACADKVTWTDKDKNLRVEVSSMYLSFFQRDQFRNGIETFP